MSVSDTCEENALVRTSLLPSCSCHFKPQGFEYLIYNCPLNM